MLLLSSAWFPPSGVDCAGCLLFNQRYVPVFPLSYSHLAGGHKGKWLDGAKWMGLAVKKWGLGLDWVSIFGGRSQVMAHWQHMSRPGVHTPRVCWMGVCGSLAICPPSTHWAQAKWPNAAIHTKTHNSLLLSLPFWSGSAFENRLCYLHNKSHSWCCWHSANENSNTKDSERWRFCYIIFLEFHLVCLVLKVGLL